MSQAASLRQLVQDIVADGDDYARLHELLEAQFAAALAHRSADIADIGGGILALAETLESRRARRVEIVARLTGEDPVPSIERAWPLLPPASRPQVAALWAALETRVQACKALNARNCHLLTAQFEIMQRVLDVETDTYAPA